MHPDTSRRHLPARRACEEPAAVADGRSLRRAIRAAGLDDVAICSSSTLAASARSGATTSVTSSASASTGRMRIAERDGLRPSAILCAPSAAMRALLGRLASCPRRGGGASDSALVCDVAGVRRGQRAAHRCLLSTQTDNAAARALYLRAGFRDTGRRYAFLRFGSDAGMRGEHASRPSARASSTPHCSSRRSIIAIVVGVGLMIAPSRAPSSSWRSLGLALVAVGTVVARLATRPDHLRAMQSHQILEIAERSLALPSQGPRCRDRPGRLPPRAR